MDAKLYEDTFLNRKYNFAGRKVAKNKTLGLTSRLVFLPIKITLKRFLEAFLVRLLIFIHQGNMNVIKNDWFSYALQF